MNISVMGSGYVGLVTAACLAEKGNQVINADIDEERIERLNNGEILIHEQGLEEIVGVQMASHGEDVPNLRFSTDIPFAIRQSDLIYIAVGTPSAGEMMDLRYLWRVVEDIAEFSDNKKIVVVKSTVPPGTTDNVQRYFKHKDKRIVVVSNPEFLVEGKAVESTKKPDRIVVGTNHLAHVKPVFDQLYSPFVVREGKLLYMQPIDAELTKAGANSMLAARISSINEIAMLAEKLGADIGNVRMGIGNDKRIGLQYLFAGPGYGGSCFPKDLTMLAGLMEELGVTPHMLRATIERNEEQKKVLPNKVIERFGDSDESLNGRIFGLWGLAFKADTDDIRDSPALYVVEELTKRGALVQAYDPEAGENASNYFSDLIENEQLRIMDGPYRAIDHADGLVIATEWDVFRSPNFARMLEDMRTPVIFDGRRLFDPGIMSNNSFEYHSIGRSSVMPVK